jgi:glycerol-3-phosphate acyltransferase PlsY
VFGVPTVAAEPKVSALLAVALAFAAGCLPSARLVTRLARGVSIEELGDGKPGASNVYRTLGPIPGAAVLVLDSLKAYVPAASLGARGASEGVVAAAAVAPVAAHVAVIGGQGAAAALGAGFAIDTPATLIAVIPILGGTLLGYHAQGRAGSPCRRRHCL